MSSRGKLTSEPVEESARKTLADVLGKARAALKQSQQFRTISRKDDKNNNLSSRLVFQQQTTAPDNWAAIAEPQVLQPNDDELGDHYLGNRGSRKPKKLDDFGPFRESVKSPIVPHASVSRKFRDLEQQERLTTSTSQGARRSSVPSQMSRSSSTISMTTNELNVSDMEESAGSSETDSNESAVNTLKSTSKSRESKTKQHWDIPCNVRLAPLVPAPPAPAPSAASPSNAAEEKYQDSFIGEVSEGRAEGSVTVTLSKEDEVDEISFSRAFMKDKSGKDPHWFEKALLVRGETISEAAYNAIKTIYKKKEVEEEKLREIQEAKKNPIFKDMTDPEYTADWISEIGTTGSAVDHRHKQTESVAEVPELVDEEIEEVFEREELNTASMVQSASELETSGILEEIAENLQEVLEISEMPESQDFSSMSAEEKSFAKEYDEAMQDSNEPLQSVFAGAEPTGGSSREDHNVVDDEIISSSKEHPDNTLLESQITGEVDYENTFISTKTSDSSTFKASKSKRIPSKSKTSTSFSSEINKSKSASGPSIPKSKSASASVAKSKSSKSKSAISSRRQGTLPPEHALEPPTSRYQKNIQTVLEKEVYQKELKRVRSQKLKEERNADRIKQLAKESLERNQTTSYKDPDYTEILLPELFKYKSVSGLKAAKAKRTTKQVGPPFINYGAPYFESNGALSTSDYGVTNMAAQVEGLDIPDLVREVLASNERMYKMTVDASKQMAKNYRDKLRMKTNDGNNKRR